MWVTALKGILRTLNFLLSQTIHIGVPPILNIKPLADYEM